MDKKIFSLIKKEIERQKRTINLIPSENYASLEVLKVLGSPLVNKYSEGYPKKRYYPGNEIYDEIEKISQERALKFFNLNSKKWSVNLQPYSGSPANLEVYFALLDFGDKILTLDLFSGGHLTHGHLVNFSGKAYKVIHYHLNPKTELIDYEGIEKLAFKYRPKMVVSGATSYPRKIDFRKIGLISKKINAFHLADISHIAGLIATGFHPNPFPYSDVVMTTTHKILRGPRGAIIFSRKEISEKINRSVFPGMQGGPHNNVIAAKGVMFFEDLKPNYKKYCQQVIKNAKILAFYLKKFGFKLISGGTDNHLILIDLRNKNLDGYQAEKKLEEVGILANRNVIPKDKSALRPSGLRIGTPAVTTRRMKEKEMKKIAELIFLTLLKKGKKEKIKKDVLLLTKKFPIPDYEIN